MASKETIKISGAENFLTMKVQLSALVKKEREGVYMSYCPALDLYSRGDTGAEAKKMLAEAISLFIEDCFNHGTLKEVLEDCGFHTMHEKSPRKKRKFIPPAAMSGGRTVRIPAEVPIMAAA